jgi:glycosyltransferase involved in cell wall biosynthesis
MSGRKTVNIFLQYYYPHVSGLTNMAIELAEFLAANGFSVNVYSNGAKNLPKSECINGVQVHRSKVWLRLGRASFAPGLFVKAFKIRKELALTHMHLPYPEAGPISYMLRSQTQLITYQCDSALESKFDHVIAKLLDASHKSSMRRAKFVVFSSRDYASNSRLNDTLRHPGFQVIPATSKERSGGVPEFKEASFRTIGFLGRATSEKGIEILIEALELLPDNYLLLMAGPTDTSENSYSEKLLTSIKSNPKVRHLGLLREDKLVNFYASLDVFVLPSTNSFEAFGIVQLEAMSAGIPVVATNIPGVRTIVQETGFGEIVEPKSPMQIALAIENVLIQTYDVGKIKELLDATYFSPSPQERYIRLVRSSFTD